MFRTSGIRGRVGSEVTAEMTFYVGRALASSGYGRIVVGRDVRESSRMLERALVAGVTECGGTVTAVGVETTPTIARYVGEIGADAGVVITASHNPLQTTGSNCGRRAGRRSTQKRRQRPPRPLRHATSTLRPTMASGTGQRRATPATTTRRCSRMR
jgi:phosphoglucosamine mutase